MTYGNIRKCSNHALTADHADFNATTELARHFWTVSAADVMGLGEAEGAIVRVTGEVDEATFAQVADKVRELKARGTIIRNDCSG